MYQFFGMPTLGKPKNQVDQRATPASIATAAARPATNPVSTTRTAIKAKNTQNNGQIVPVKASKPSKSAKTHTEPTVGEVTAREQAAGKEEPKIIRIRRFLYHRYEFRYDIVANDLEWRSRGNLPNGQPGVFEPINENTLMVELFESGYLGFKDQLNALLRSSWVPTIDPIRAYFESLPTWDNSKPDYITQLANYMVSTDRDWFLAQYRKMLVRTAACALGEIPFNKQCMVLVSEQNDGKTSFIRFHCPPALEKYYTEQIDFDNKDGQIALAGNFIINIDELANFSKIDINKCKAYFTTDKIKVRHPFDTKPKITKRRASFFASTNEAAFLTDPTGNVRWLIMEVKEILHDDGGAKGYARNVDIDNVWAQAYALMKSGFKYQMTREDIAQSEKRNRQHLRVSMEQELVLKHLQSAEPKADEAHYLMPGEIVRWLEKHYEYRIKINNINMGRALTALGFPLIRGRRTDCTYPISGYWVKFFF